MIAKTLDSETVNAAYGALILKNIQDKVNADAVVPDSPADSRVSISFYTRVPAGSAKPRQRVRRGRLG